MHDSVWSRVQFARHWLPQWPLRDFLSVLCLRQVSGKYPRHVDRGRMMTAPLRARASRPRRLHARARITKGLAHAKISVGRFSLLGLVESMTAVVRQGYDIYLTRHSLRADRRPLPHALGRIVENESWRRRSAVRTQDTSWHSLKRVLIAGFDAQSLGVLHVAPFSYYLPSKRSSDYHP